MVAQCDKTPRAAMAAQPLITWLVEQGLEGTSQEALLQGYCDRLVDLGVPLWRFFLGQRAFHPRFGGIGFQWTAAEGISSRAFAYEETPRNEWLRSPLFSFVQNGMSDQRYDLQTGTDYQQYPLLEDLKAQGATDYFISGLHFAKVDTENYQDPNQAPEGVLISWCTDRDGGFSAYEVELMKTAMPYLGLALKSTANRRMAADLLKVYLGRESGRRVLSGEIQRGSSRQIDAVICLFDLKGFTSLAEQIPGPDLIDMLNDYFGIAVAAIQSHGGNILKFIGDGILTMFDLGSSQLDARAALEAAKDLRAQISQRNSERLAEGLPVADFTLALHAGEILYGNIGAENRLDFTVIGPAVNLTARLSNMHEAVGQNIILSEKVQKAAGTTDHDLVSLGRYMLRGVADPIELFTVYVPDEDTA
ncbi:adenylate/guanylate cyclase domain-containing protein [Epibacterium ulvae]|uniref:adenylate/guanylate cyclase domain-containing protein n=1 Tax=Epibacterium ulvae TaxID=1156985 RepID=UPI003F6E7309